MIAVDVEQRAVAHGDEEAQILGLQISGGQDHVKSVQIARPVVLPEIPVLLVRHQKDPHSCLSPSFSGGIIRR